MPPKSYPLRRSVKTTSFSRQKKKRDAVPRRAFSSLARTPAFVHPGASSLLNGLPTRKKINLRYCDEILVTGAGTVGVHTFRLNSMFDPDYTATGHQPMGRDQWAAFYGRYVVANAVIKAEWIQETVANITPAYLAIEVSRSASAASSYPNELFENPLVSNAKLCYANVGQHTGAGATSVVQKVDMSKFLGEPDILDNSTSGANFGASPGGDHTVYAHILNIPVKGNTQSSVNVRVTIDFEVYLTQPVSITGS